MHPHLVNLWQMEAGPFPRAYESYIGASSRMRRLLRSLAYFVIVAEKQCRWGHLSHAPDPSKKAFNSSPWTMIIYSFGDILHQPTKPLFIPVWWTLFIMNRSWACQVLFLCARIWPYCFSFFACWCDKIILSDFSIANSALHTWDAPLCYRV